MKVKKTKFRFCKDDSSFEAKQDDTDWNDGLADNHSLREIAHQLKRIADVVEATADNSDFKTATPKLKHS